MIRAGMKWGHSAAARGQSESSNIGYLANRLRRYFAPSSQLQAPLSARTLTGNRNVAISASLSANNLPDDSGIVKLVNGIAVINFNTKFGNSPIITTHPIGVPTTGTGSGKAGPSIFAQALGYRSGTAPPTGAIIQSTDTTDGRYVHWHAAAKF